ncbi:heavy metal transporter [Streptomyces sp. NPDC048442]|uniref:heavy metal transporter n=1 Tax=Streptomyces sp. NPDC048442 TaxID=3154823 RepID=UPI003437F7F4
MGAVVLLALAGYVAVQYFAGGQASTRCTVRGGDGTQGSGARFELTAEQAVNAATISSVGTSRGMPERAVTIALATALQESALRNIRHGDRDSLGLFQQRPSQGWGTGEQILDPAYSAARFYQHLTEVPGYSRLPLTVAAQRVQKSGFPQAYAKHEPDAALLASALTGRTPASLSCEARRGGDDGKQGDPAKVRVGLTGAFGAGVLARTRAAGSPTGGSSDARTVVVPVPGAGRSDLGAGGFDTFADPAQQRGWQLAHWAMAHSAELRITRITYAGQEWNTGQAAKGWQPAPAKSAAASASEVRISTAP